VFTGASRFVVRSTEQASLARAPDRMRRLCCALIAGALLIQVSALAARNFPQSAKRGALTAHQYPYYTIDKSTRRIAVGGKIYNHHNLIIMPVSLQSQTAEIMYSVDTNGELSAIWLLTPEEAAKYPRATEPEPQPVPQPEPEPEPESES
jgi:hypothetical protein